MPDSRDASVPITDAMVERARVSLEASAQWPTTHPLRWSGWDHRLRTALDAALNGGDDA